MSQKANSYFKFNSYGLSSWADRALWKIRSRIYALFAEGFRFDENTKVLDVGVSADDHPASNFFEKLYPYSGQLTAAGLGDFESLEKAYPGLRYRKVDGRSLPFSDGEFDLVFSHAVIEHVGSTERQVSFIKELLRVANKGVFFTTPSRSHFLELHTGLPLLHYLPQRIARGFYKLLGKGFYASEENLNLLYARDIRKTLKRLSIANFEIKKVRWLGMTSNLVVVIRKS